MRTLQHYSKQQVKSKKREKMNQETRDFIQACKEGDIDEVRRLLTLDGKHRVDVHAEDEAAFRKACWYNHESVVRLLLELEGERRIDVHAKDEYAFRWACHEGKESIVRLLLALEGDRQVDVHADNDYGRETSFRVACRFGYESIVRLLLGLEGDRKIDVNAEGDCYIKDHDSEREKDDDYDEVEGAPSAFGWACEEGHESVVRLLLDLEGDQRIDVH